MKKLKRLIIAAWSVETHIRWHISIVRWLHYRIPYLGKAMSMVLDRLMMIAYAIDLRSSSINVKCLSISHPIGILLGGNGIFSKGRVAIMAGVKLVARNPTHQEYLQRHKEQRVFIFGDNVVIGANTVVIGPVEICDNVIIGAMSLVNRNIAEPGVYVGSPARKVSDVVTDEWLSHLSQ